MMENQYQDNELLFGKNAASVLHTEDVHLKFGEKALIACVLYTLLYTFCIYKNISGVTMPIWVLGMLGLSAYFLRLMGKTMKKDSIFIVVMMFLIGVSTFLTGNMYIIYMNYPAEFLLLVSFLLHNFSDDAKWDMGKYVVQIINAVFGAISCIGKPFSEINFFIKAHKKEKSGKAQYVILGIVVALPVVAFLSFLLGTADRVFEHLMVQVLNSFTIPEKLFGILFMLLFGFFSSFCGLYYIAEHSDKITVKEYRNGEPVLAITITGMISGLYLVFSVIQILYLFLGNMTLPDGVTYAQYARTGFFQLLFVCVMNLILVLSMKKYFRESKVLNVILLVISGCTYIMTISSALRMSMYIRSYQLTFLRVFVLVALFTIAVLLVGVILAILKPDFSFFRFGVVVISVVYVLFAFSHVDYFIAKYNLQRVEAQEEQSGFGSYLADYQYISNLSTDAAPVIVEYAMNHGQGLKSWFKAYYFENEEVMSHITVRNFNVSHFYAREIFRR